MKYNTKIYNRFKGFTLEDCDCRYCLYYGGRRKGKVNCLADESIVPKCGYGGGSLWLRAGAVWMESDRL